MTGTIALGADHAGYALKSALAKALGEAGWEILDLGVRSDAESVDYPGFGRAVAEAVRDGRARCGLLVCGTGIGIAMAANRLPGARAAVCHDVTSARLARRHNDANILALGARLVGIETARETLAAFLESEFEGGRHARRVSQIDRPPPDSDGPPDSDIKEPPA